METLSTQSARRLALIKGGLLKPEWTDLPHRVPKNRRESATRAMTVIARFGYLQLDSVSVAGARSHSIVLMSRLEGFPSRLGEELLDPGQPLFEYWGHEASWIPFDLYPVFAFRRKQFRTHPWWGDLLKAHPRVATAILDKVRDRGAIRSEELGEKNRGGWWNLGTAKKVASALWSRGDLAILKRRHFHRWYDLPERVIPDEFRKRTTPEKEALEILLRRALEGHGWASRSTLAATWRLKHSGKEVSSALDRLRQKGIASPCSIHGEDGKTTEGWILRHDLDLAGRADRLRPRKDRGVLLSPFDPVLWDRDRVSRLFGFHQVLEIYKPAPQRIYGYYCLPVLAGDELVGRVDLKAHHKKGELEVRARHYGKESPGGAPTKETKRALNSAMERFAKSLGIGKIV